MYSYVTRIYPYVIRMYPYAGRILVHVSLCTRMFRMLLVCYS